MIMIHISHNITLSKNQSHSTMPPKNTAGTKRQKKSGKTPKPPQPLTHFLSSVSFFSLGIFGIVLLYSFYWAPVASPIKLAVSSSITSTSNETSMFHLIYFMVVTLSTVGYGDYSPYPTEKWTKFCLAVGILIWTIVIAHYVATLSEILDFVEKKLARRFRKYPLAVVLLDPYDKNKIKNVVKIVLALLMILFAVVVGFLIAHLCQGFDTPDSFYFSVVSVTTIGFGDLLLTKSACQFIGIIWLFNSTIFTSMAYSFLAQVSFKKKAESRVDFILTRDFDVGSFREALEMVNSGKPAGDETRADEISELEFTRYMLREMKMVSERDLERVHQKFENIGYQKHNKKICRWNCRGFHKKLVEMHQDPRA